MNGWVWPTEYRAFQNKILFFITYSDNLFGSFLELEAQKMYIDKKNVNFFIHLFVIIRWTDCFNHLSAKNLIDSGCFIIPYRKPVYMNIGKELWNRRYIQVKFIYGMYNFCFEFQFSSKNRTRFLVHKVTEWFCSNNCFFKKGIVFKREEVKIQN